MSPVWLSVVCGCHLALPQAGVVIISCGTPSPPPYFYRICFPFPPAFLRSDSILCSRMDDNCCYSLLGEEYIH